MKKLTPYQEELYIFIVEYVSRYQNFPTTRACVEGTSYKSNSAVYSTITGRFVTDKLVEKHTVDYGPTLFSIAEMKIIPPMKYLEILTPTFSQAMREALHASQNKATPQ